MFCAGLLLSIADLLTYQTAYRTLDRYPRTKTPTHFRRLRRRVGSKQQHVPVGLPAQPETRGDICWLPLRHDPYRNFVNHVSQAPSPEVSFEYDTVSPAAFQPRTAENLFGTGLRSAEVEIVIPNGALVIAPRDLSHQSCGAPAKCTPARSGATRTNQKRRVRHPKCGSSPR